MKKYTTYKPSGIEWIGDIPEHWNVDKLKYVSNIKGSNVDKLIYENENQVFLCNYTDVYKNEFINDKISFTKGSCTDEELNKFKLKEGDVIITKDSESPDDIGVPSYVCKDFQDVVCGYHLTMISPNHNDLNGNFLFRQLQTKRVKSYFKVNSNGITRFGLGKSPIENLKLILPPYQEQHQIVHFLDEKNEIIDKLISTKKNKIDLLKEQRKSLINQVITKGLDPNVKIKDSGVEWIGDIPSHWKITPLRFLGFFQNGISKSSEFFGTGYPFMNYGDVYKNEITPESVEGKVQSTETDRIQYSVIRGDIFFTRTSESKDDIGVSSTCLKTIPECVFSGFVIRFRFYERTHIPEYSRNHFQTYWKKVFIESKMDIVTRSSLSQQVLGQVPVLIPPIDEQQQIVEYLDNRTKEIDDLMSLEQKKIEVLKEYRQSLISEVITGKIDVRTNLK